MAPRHARGDRRGIIVARARCCTNNGISASRMSGVCVCTSQTGVVPQVLRQRANAYGSKSDPYPVDSGPP